MSNPTQSMKNYLNIVPTADQVNVLNVCQSFLKENQNDDFLVISGSAGTGKTTLVKAITDYLQASNRNFTLAAPTGRAAKVISKKTQFHAKTIHSLIYIPEIIEETGCIRMNPKQNLKEDLTTYIIDESSMISDRLQNSENFISERPLLTDLLEFVKQGNEHNKIIFVGDPYQLPPIHETDSPALLPEYLTKRKGLKGGMVELTEVKRQQSDSYILENATALRNSIKDKKKFDGINCKTLHNSSSAIYHFLDSYDPERFDKVTVLTFTNNDANWFNNALRERLYLSSSLLSIGEQVHVHQNWYGPGITIAKGECGIVRDIKYTNEKVAGLNFAEVVIEFSNSYGEKYAIQTKVLLDVLKTKNGELTRENEKNLYHEAMLTNKKFRESKLASDDPYYGAIRLRYAYATTCHKAQGSEWEEVIVHPYYNKNDYRWQYTAITRAVKELYTYNQKNNYF